LEAIGKVHIPPAFMTVNPHGNLAKRGGVIHPIAQNNEIRTELGN